MPGTSHIKGHELKPDVVPLEFEHQHEHYSGHAIPVKTAGRDDGYLELDVTLNAEHLGSIYSGSNQLWTMKDTRQELVDKIGEIISAWYE